MLCFINAKMRESENILFNHNRETACKDIFQAACDEIGLYFEQKGLKYSRSRPKLTLKDEEILLTIPFFSSASNQPGESVCMDILPNIQSVQLMKEKHPKPYILATSAMLTMKGDWENSQLVKSETVFGEKVERIVERSKEPLFMYSNTINVYGITKEQFQLLLSFIEEKIIIWFELIKKPEGISRILDNRNYRTNYEIEHSGLLDYAKLKFPELIFN